MMEHVFKALDEQIAHNEWLLKCERNAKDALEKDNEALRTECKRLEGEVYKLTQRIGTLETLIKSIPPTLSKAQYDEVQAFAGPLEEVAHELA